jgi:outer membrane protein TolC
MALRQAKLSYTIAELRLKNYLGITDEVRLKAQVEEDIPQIQIDIEKAINMAVTNNSSQIQWEANQLNADREVANAKAGQRPNIDLFANYGLSRSAAELDEVYQDPQDQQLLRIGFRVPIVNWGRAKADYQAAMAQQEVTNANYQMALLEFQQNVLSQVKNFELKYKEVELAIRADEVAAKRFFVTQQRFKIGKIGMTDLNIAIREKDEARRSYVNALQSFWNSYYELRKLTHYDFRNAQIIQHDTPDVR